MPLPELNLTDEQICQTYPRLLQLDGTKIYDGLGNLIVDLATLTTTPIGPALQNSTIIPLVSGYNQVLSINKEDYKGGFVDYVITNGINQRSGNIIITTDGYEIHHTELTTNDIGNTNTIHFDVLLDDDTINLIVTGVPSNSIYQLRLVYKFI